MDERDPVPGISAPPPSPVRGRDLALVVALSVSAVLAVAFFVEVPTRTITVVLGLLLLQSAIPFAVVYLVLIVGRGVRWRALGFVRPSRGWYLRAVLVTLATLLLVAGLNYLVQTLAGVEFRNPQIDVLAPEGFSWLGLFGTLAVVGLLGPVVEEILFRALVYGWLRTRIGVPAAALVSGAVFGAAHGIAMLAPALAVQGIVLALVYERSGSLWVPIIVHALFNATMIVLLYAAMAAAGPLGP